MRALQRVADKVCSSRQEKSIYTKLGSLIMDQHEEEKVIQLFKALSGETSLQSLPEEISAALPQAASSLDTTTWRSAKSWVQWWTKPTHLSKIMWDHNIYHLANWIESRGPRSSRVLLWVNAFQILVHPTTKLSYIFRPCQFNSLFNGPDRPYFADSKKIKIN